MPDYSVITPCYNSFDLMERYFASFERQTHRNFELIIVDDCSTDDSYARLQEKAAASELRIRVYRTGTNGGAGAARNVGLAHAEGKWVTFVDSDDYVSDDLFEMLDAHIEDAHGALLFDFQRSCDGATSYCDLIRGLPEGFVDRDDAVVRSLTCVCGAVYKRADIVTHHIAFPPIRRFEDFVFKVRFLLCCDKVYYLKKPLYTYVDNTRSVTHQSNALPHAEAAMDIIGSFADKRSAVYEALFIREVFYLTLKEHASDPDLKDRMKALTAAYPQWKKNPYVRTFQKNQRVLLLLYKLKLLFAIKLLIRLKK